MSQLVMNKFDTIFFEILSIFYIDYFCWKEEYWTYSDWVITGFAGSEIGGSTRATLQGFVSIISNIYRTYIFYILTYSDSLLDVFKRFKKIEFIPNEICFRNWNNFFYSKNKVILFKSKITFRRKGEGSVVNFRQFIDLVCIVRCILGVNFVFRIELCDTMLYIRGVSNIH